MEAQMTESSKSEVFKRIKFSYDFKDFKYNISFYRAKMSKNKLPKHELISFFSNMYLKLNDFSALKELSASLIKTFILSSTLFVIGLFVSVYGYFFISNSWLILAGICLILIACTYIYAFRMRQKRIREEILKKTRSDINQFLNEHSGLFEKKKVKWNLPSDHFEWIELEVDDLNEFPQTSESVLVDTKISETEKFIFDSENITNLSPTERA